MQTTGGRRRVNRPASSTIRACQSAGIGSTSRSMRWNRMIRTAASDHQANAPASISAQYTSAPSATGPEGSQPPAVRFRLVRSAAGAHQYHQHIPGTRPPSVPASGSKSSSGAPTSSDTAAVDGRHDDGNGIANGTSGGVTSFRIASRQRLWIKAGRRQARPRRRPDRQDGHGHRIAQNALNERVHEWVLGHQSFVIG